MAKTPSSTPICGCFPAISAASPLRALVINLPQEAARRAFQQRQARALGLTLEILPAVDVARIAEADLDWTRWQRPLRDVEKAALLSHRAAWRRALDRDAPTLILEDDAWLMPAAPALLDRVASLPHIDHLSLETRGRKKILGAVHPDLPGLRRLWLDRTGAAAYLLWPEGARRLLDRSTRVPALADAVPVETRGLRRWQADPAMALQIDMAQHYGLTPPIPVASTISTVARPAERTARQRLSRLAGQFSMGLQHLRPGTERREIRPDRRDI